TVFAWERVEKPLQVVRREAVLPVLREDWRGLPEPERESRLAAYLEADRAQGFDLARGPLMRVALFRVGEATHDVVWTHHHLIVDGWSLGLVYRDVVALYRARVEGREPPPSDARPYRDYVAWLGGRDPDRAERFWRSALAGVTEPTPLGIDTREVSPGSPGAAEAAIVLLPDRTAALDALARGNGLTTSTLVQGAWALLLSRYSGEEDVLFGTTVSGRPAELDGAEEMVGLFINALPIRARVTPEARTLPWLRALQEHQAEMREHEHTPLVRVQEWSEIPRGRPLFESFLSFQNFPVDSSAAAVAGLRVEGVWGRSETNHPLTLSAELSGSELSLHALYAPSRFAPAAVRRLLEHLAAVLDAFAARPEARLGEVSVLAPGERDRLRRWSAGPESPPAEGLAHEVFESWARRTPDAVAVEHDGGSLTYAELDRRANRLAHALLGRGVGRGGRVGVCLEAGPEVLVAVLGAWKAGAAYVPLDPEHPAERLEYVTADAAVPVIVTRSELAGRVLGGGAEVLALDDGAARVDAGPDGAPGIALSPRELAYVIYTSGSTGRPKGVLVEHASLAGTLLGVREALGFGPGDVSPGLSGFAFDIWLFESVLPLLAGGRVRTVARERVLDSDALLRELDDATVLHAVPALMRQVVDACAAGAGLPRLRHVFVGGDAVPPALLAQMRAAFPS
ncbi:MAG TPA: condensation domain-containing protein, partial [Longimicrobiaceae bacterium]